MEVGGLAGGSLQVKHPKFVVVVTSPAKALELDGRDLADR